MLGTAVPQVNHHCTFETPGFQPKTVLLGSCSSLASVLSYAVGVAFAVAELEQVSGGGSPFLG